MSDIRVNRWLHQSGTGGVYQDSSGRVGIGTSVPTSSLDVQSGTIKIGNNTLSSSGVSTFTNLVVSAGSTSAPSISPTGDSNTGIFFPSPDTVAIAEGGVEALRIDSSGNFGVGTKTPVSFSQQTHVTVNYSGSGTQVSGYNLSVNDTKYASIITYPSNTEGLRIATSTSLPLTFQVNNSEVGRFDTSGNLQVANGNIVFSTAGKGIDFSATANSSGTMTSELLNDYEEGTWTPTILNGGTVSGINDASYTKVGRLVTVYFYISTSSIPSNGTQFQIGGLPYTVKGGNHYSTGQIGYCGTFNLGPWRPVVLTNGSYIYFHRIDGSNATLLNSGATGLAELLISLWYYAA